jgi:hypothetical protein
MKPRKVIFFLFQIKCLFHTGLLAYNPVGFDIFHCHSKAFLHNPHSITYSMPSASGGMS